MKIYNYLFLAFFLPFLAVGQDTLYYPIDIVYYQSTETYYVSNWADGEGYILKLDMDGNIVETYFDGLHYAGGLCIIENILYVLDNFDLETSATNLPSFLIGIDLNSGNEVLNIEISTGGTYLNFVEKANNGYLYISDNQKSTIYKYSIQNNTIENFLTGLNNPFGICYDDYNDRLLFSELGYKISYLKSVHPSGGEVTTPYYTDAYIKGVVMHPDGDFYYTTWDVNSIQWGDEEVRKVNYNFIWNYIPSDNHNRPFGLCVGYDNILVVCNWGDHTLSFIEDAVFSVEELSAKANRYSVYPNPTNGKFYIGFTDVINSEMEIVILNMTGQQVYHEKINNSNMLTEKEFDLQGLPAGTYVVILKDDRSVFQKKLIIN